MPFPEALGSVEILGPGRMVAAGVLPVTVQEQLVQLAREILVPTAPGRHQPDGGRGQHPAQRRHAGAQWNRTVTG